MSTDFLGDALSPRPRQKTHRYRRTNGMASTIDAVRVDVSENLTGGTYASTSLPGSEFERMRRYGLVLAKWSHPDISKSAKRWGVTPEQAETANRVVSTQMFKHIYDEDPTDGTLNIQPYVSAFATGEPNSQLVSAALSLHGTKAFDKLVKELKPLDPQVAEILENAGTELSDHLKYRLSWADGLHLDSRSARRHAGYLYQGLAQLTRQASDLIEQVSRERQERKRKASKPQPGGSASGTIKPGDVVPESKRVMVGKTIIPIDEYNTAGWMRPFLCKHELVLPHTGKAGRRMIPWMEGKYPTHFHRIITDPFKRIFQRKTRALGGVVVFDCSGSMGLDDDDIKRVMAASSGCSIVCYSAGPSESYDAERGNIHLVARHGRQMRGLPHFYGNNGVDLPALKWAYYNLRLNSKSPVIWVSDGQVTGRGDAQTQALLDETDKFIRRKRIIQADSPGEAVRLLAQLQRKAIK